jgi:hypothetical protein
MNDVLSDRIPDQHGPHQPRSALLAVGRPHSTGLDWRSFWRLDGHNDASGNIVSVFSN